MSARHHAKRRKLRQAEPQYLLIDLTLSETESEPSKQTSESKAAPQNPAPQREKAKLQTHFPLRIASTQPKPTSNPVPRPLSAKPARVLRPSMPSRMKPKSHSDRHSELLNPEKQESESEAEHDALNHFLNTLDGLDRETHLGFLTNRIVAAEKVVGAIKIVTYTWGELYSNMLVEVKRTRRYANQVVNFEIDFDARSQKESGKKAEAYLHTNKYLRRRARRVENGCSVLEQMDELLEKLARHCALARELCDILIRSTTSLENLEGFWTIVWDIYDDMSQPGSRQICLDQYLESVLGERVATY